MEQIRFTRYAGRQITALKKRSDPLVLLIEISTIARHDSAHELANRLFILVLIDKKMHVVRHEAEG